MRNSVLSAIAASTLLFAAVQASAQTAPMTASTMSMPASASTAPMKKKTMHHKKTKPAAASSAPQK